MDCCSKLTSRPSWYRQPKPEEFTSTWLPVSSKFFLAFRWLTACLSVVALIHGIIKRALKSVNDPEQYNNVYKYPIYLTNWNRILAAVSLIVDAAITTISFQKEGDTKATFVENSSLPLMYRVLWCMYTIITPISFLVTGVYWSLMYNPTIHTLNFDNFFAHLFVTVIAITDIVISRKPWALKHFYQPLVFCVLWCIFSVIYWSLGGTSYHGEPYIYKILNWGGDPKIFSSVLVGVAIFLIFMHSIIAGIVRLRNWMEKRWGRPKLEHYFEENDLNIL